jgi:hypothetical protein
VQETGNRAEEAVMSWNIGMIYKQRGDLRKAEPYISRAVQLAEEIGHPSRENTARHWQTFAPSCGASRGRPLCGVDASRNVAYHVR